jgi:hypothetical protein
MTNTSKSGSLDLEIDYRDFCLEEVAAGVSIVSIPTFDQFKEIRSEMSSDKDLKFVSPNKLGNLAGAAGAAFQNPSIRRMMDAGVDAVSREGVRIAEGIAGRLASGEAFVKVKRDFGDTGGNSGRGAGGDGSAGNPFNPNRMNYNPKPVQVRLSTPIRPKTYGEYYPESKPEMNVMDLTQVTLQVPEGAASELKSYFDTVITFNFQNDAQMRVNFNVDAINKFSATNLRDWMNKYANAYSKYVWYTSIINYCNEPLQQNAGMRALRAMMTPTLLDDLSQLANMLDGTPCPPKFRELIHFVYGAPFKVSNNPGSQIRMISPSVLIHSSGEQGSALDQLPADDIQGVITNLFNMRETTALIARVCPSWIPGRGNTPAGAAVCEYSPNWSTLWENLPYHVYAGGTQHFGPSVSTENQDATYGSSADTLDGAVTALWNAYDTTASGSYLERFRPGTIIPIASGTSGSTPGITTYSNRIQYKLDITSGTPGFYLTAVGSNQMNYMRLETYTVTGNGISHPVVWPGRELINNMNIASSRQTAYELYSWMFDMGGTSNPSFSRDSGSKRRRGGKTKMDSSETKEEI